MPTNDQDARALTYLARRLRDETRDANNWDEAGTYAKIAGLIGRNLALTIEQVARHAADPEAKTPGAILRPFLPGPPQPEANHPPKADAMCQIHGGHIDGCHGCAADRLVGDPTPKPREASPPTDLWREERARARTAPGATDTAQGPGIEEITQGESS